MIVAFTDKLSEDKGVSPMTAVGLNLADACSVDETKRKAPTSVGSGEELSVGI
jgi:hypothetical protein